MRGEGTPPTKEKLAIRGSIHSFTLVATSGQRVGSSGRRTIVARRARHLRPIHPFAFLACQPTCPPSA